MHMINKGQLDCPGGQLTSAAAQFYSLAVRSVADGAVSLILTPLLQQNRRGSVRSAPTDQAARAVSCSRTHCRVKALSL